MTVIETPEARLFPFGLELRDVDTTESLSMLAGRAVPYNTRTELNGFSEEIAPGTFARSIKQDAVSLPLHLFHGDAPELGGNPMTPWPIGIAHEWRDRPDGLHGVWRLDQGEEAQRAARMARDGMLPYLSVRFQAVPNKTDIRYEGERPHMIRRQARLVSTSLVSTPAYREAGVDWVRSAPLPVRPGAPGTALEEWTRYLDQVRQGPVTEIRAVSDKPWSSFTNADYTDAQYARACILDRGPAAGPAKQRYSLPVREPLGALNRNGCHSAAAALAGARGGGIDATPEQKQAAARKLLSLYRTQLREDPPESLVQLAS
jgi:HK97 family phage prohead protease